MKTIAVYGSSMVLPGSDEYEDSLKVGAALGAAGYTVMTGGYAGVMEAASKGACDAGGHVIGVTTGRIEAFRGGDTKPNQWVVDEIRHPTLRERLMHLVLEANGYVCMPGGIGTLHELITVWELMRVGDIEVCPLICYGEYWRTMLAQMYESPFIKTASWDMLQFVDTPAQVIEILDAEFKSMSRASIEAHRKEKDRIYKTSPNSPLLTAQKIAFSKLDYFDYNPELDFEVEITLFEDQDVAYVHTTQNEIRNYTRYGEFTFAVNDEDARLTVYQTPHGFFIPFVDANVGKETYPAGRYIDPEQLDDITFHVDFNLAYNPLCAYNDKWNCPITPAENRLNIVIQAGEKLPTGEWVKIEK